jgi:murein DD-endopeptidase MepM/ murein hydrolase activator NlpD
MSYDSFYSGYSISSRLMLKGIRFFSLPIYRICMMGIIFFCISIFSFCMPPVLSAQTVTAPADIQGKIDQRNEDIKALEKEIAGYQKQLTEISSQASSLASTLKTLDLTKKKLEADIKITESRIIEKNIQIKNLGVDISDKEDTIADNHRIIASTYATMNELGSQSVPELLLSKHSVSGTLNSLDMIASVQNGLFERINNLRQAKASLEVNKLATEKARGELIKLSNQLKDQRSIVLGTVAEKNLLLKETKQSEAEYQRILAANKKLKEDFEREVLDYESKLKFALDPNSIPSSGSGVLQWPLDSVPGTTPYVTQYFGVTDFSKNSSGRRIYNGQGHSGVDFRASIGTPVKAALSGIITVVENKYSGPKCYPYGRWVMIKHANGLSSLYAHFSLATVSVGQSVSTGQIIGYSGNSGLVTGPHLHFGLYVTEGLEFTPACGGITKNPRSAFSAKLDPMVYF